MHDDLNNWERPHFKAGGGDPFLFYVVYGPTPSEWTVSRSQFRCAGVPPEVEVMAYGPESRPEVLDSFRVGYLWDELVVSNEQLANAVLRQTERQILRGSIPDPSDLNYFRDIVGLIEWLLASAGVAVFDPMAFKWWSVGDWHDNAFESTSGSPRHHVTILKSDMNDGDWLHTRGMIKFGRPDLSIHQVYEQRRELAVEILNRFIEFQAFGGIIEEGQQIHISSAPAGMYCYRRGDFDDPEFNNVHVEICWPD